ncbi:hypothetical protein BJF78_24910 [Pseudonocardia sp. CNS-139]|nr:hypothetical protein BJF78_24910 [Pseudonocardia sp. CNS-139]
MDIDAFERLLPEVTDVNRGYWDGLAARELRLQKCAHDGAVRFPASPVCPGCLSPDSAWTAMSGRATLWSWIVMHQRYFDAFADERPYLVAFVRLAEGPFMVSTVVADPAALRVDLPLELEFREIGDHLVPCFRPAR